MGHNNQMLDSKSIIILHQNICGLKRKTNELLSAMSPDLPHVLCLSKHHLKRTELEQININDYRLGASYCRQAVKKGGTYTKRSNNSTGNYMRPTWKEPLHIKVCGSML